MITREKLISLQDIATEKINIPEWDDDALVRGMTAHDRQAMALTFADSNGQFRAESMQVVTMQAWVAARCVVDEQGKRVFGDEDIAMLGEHHPKALERIFAAAMRLSGITEPEVENLRKN